jgi:amino acid adenylation domain-containing protein
MELQTLSRTAPETFWKSISSDLQHAGLLPAKGFHPPAQVPSFNAQLRFPLAHIEAVHSQLPVETILRASWAVTLTRHTSVADTLFFSSFDHEKPWLSLIRTVVPARQIVSGWLVEFDGLLREAQERGPIPAEVLARLEEEELARGLPTFLIIPVDAKAFPPRDQIKGPLLVLVRLDTSTLEIHYDSNWYDQTQVQALGDHFNIVLEGIAAGPDQLVGNLPLLTVSERHLLLDYWNDTGVPFAEETCIHEFFQAQVARTPDAVAIVFRDEQWTYCELDARAEVLAARLRSAGVGPGTFVAICLNRSLELMATLLGVFKAGGAYLPLDPTYPAERLTFMIEDAKPAVIVVSKETGEIFGLPGQRLFWVDGTGDQVAQDESAKTSGSAKSSDAAYVLYTSGSTGKPKGVVVTHRNVSNFFTAMDAVIGTESGTWLAVTSINFDISVFELFWTLARGFRTILQEEGPWASPTGSKFSMSEQMKRHGVTHLQCTPSLASMLICDSESVDALLQLRRFMVGGEPLPLDLGHRLADIIAGDLFNLYGPTETTVWSAAQRVSRREKQILIGRPVANTQFYILDAERELVPIGSVGELYIGGAGLAREYLNRPDVTQERFITHSFSPMRTERLYRTGDTVRYAGDGRLEFVGRVDQQIKIHGVRIELGEIEVVLREHPEIRDAVVMAQEGEKDDKRLVAYAIASTSRPPTMTAVLQWLGTKLPKPLVPSTLVFLADFPRTANGKLDRQALPKPEQKSSLVIEGAANDLERRIAAIWSDALGIPSVGLEERFFDLGGRSLLMVEVHDQIRDKTGYDVALLDLFQYPTVRSLAQYLGQRAPKKLSETTDQTRGKLRQQSAARQNSIHNPLPTEKSS